MEFIIQRRSRSTSFPAKVFKQDTIFTYAKKINENRGSVGVSQQIMGHFHSPSVFRIDINKEKKEIEVQELKTVHYINIDTLHDLLLLTQEVGYPISISEDNSTITILDGED